MNKRVDDESAPPPVARRRDWRSIHHSPLFWFGACLFTAAITVYILTEDLSWRPRIHHSSALP
jgi:hypothetical protein